MKPQKIAIKYGILTAVILIIYFLFLGIVGLNSHPAYSFINAAISAVGISLAIKSLRAKDKKGIKYHHGFITGLFTGIYATIIFTVFFITYYSYNTAFAHELMQNVSVNMDTGLLFLTVVIMGLASTLVVTFALMQLHKNKMHPNTHKKEIP